MSIRNTAVDIWSEMSITDRQTFLEELSESLSEVKKPWWMGKSPKELSIENNFNYLPQELCGDLILAVAKNVFSVAESKRVRSL